ncbi:hypothetical protein TSUD_396390 [Trifolium subterraneum]|uniref:Reverse transcriptase domain-containing protein n=1 Tax=Trifolium subterraneum TaxID=3900 RepID=A0A2Z6N4R0_TRISU|nr:hypothetical protein TSUD_396390 [Trifolium subterraneum]
MLVRFGFGVKWRSWIRACVFSGNLSVLVNGSPTEEINIQRGFRVGNTGLSVSHLQYADDTLFIGEANVANLWTLKAILQSFELASGLKVNFAKSSVMGVNVSSNFLGVAERFLHCRVGALPFMYLGLPVGANPRNERTWKPLLDSLAKRLGDWYFSGVSRPHVLNLQGVLYGVGSMGTGRRAHIGWMLIWHAVIWSI